MRRGHAGLLPGRTLSKDIRALRISGSLIVYNGVTYHVQDRMHPSQSRHVDIFMESHAAALQFGRFQAQVQVITP